MTAMLYAAGAAVVVVLGILWRLLGNASKGGYNKKEAEDAKAEREHLQRIQDAKRAGGAIRTDPDSVYNDPQNRSRTEGNGHP